MEHAFVLTKSERKKIISLLKQINEILNNNNYDNSLDIPSTETLGLLNSKEAANYLNISLRTLQKYRDKNIIKHISISPKNIKYKKIHLDEFISEKTTQKKTKSTLKSEILSDEYIITPETHLNSISFDVRTVNALRSADLLHPSDGIPKTIKDLYDYPPSKLTNFRNVGIKTIRNLRPYFEKAGLNYIPL